MDKVNPYKLFFLLFFFGFLLAIVTPPFRVPDEINHFYRAWQVSEGVFSSVNKNQRLGGYVPKSMITFSSTFRPILTNTYNKISPAELWATHSIRLNQKDTIFVDFTNTALYSAFLYLPQALGIIVGKKLSDSPFWVFYAGRISSLIVFIILIFLTLKILPVKKWLFLILVTLPMSLSVNSSLSADMLVNAMSFLFLAIVLNLAYNDTVLKISYKHVLIIFAISVFIGLAKLVYVPLLLLLLLIPGYKFHKPYFRLLVITAAISIGFGLAIIQKKQIDSKYIPYEKYNISYRDYTLLGKGVDIKKQTEFVTGHPGYTMLVFGRSFCREFRYMTRSYIGILGWADLSIPRWFIYLSYLMIFMFTLFDFRESYAKRLSILHRILFGLVSLFIISLIMLSQYLSWDMVGEDKVYPLQGRYFIPVFPLFFIAFSDLFKIMFTLYLTPFFKKIAVAYMISSGILSIYTIISKSYTLYNYYQKKWEFRFSYKDSGKDNKDTTKYIICNADTVAVFQKPDTNYISTERVLTGVVSLKLSEQNPYGFIMKIKKGMAHEKYVVSCRYYGYSCMVVFHESPYGFYYASSRVYAEKDTLGWKYLENQIILPHKIANNSSLSIYTWYPGKDSIFIDDFRIACYTASKR